MVSTEYLDLVSTEYLDLVSTEYLGCGEHGVPRCGEHGVPRCGEHGVPRMWLARSTKDATTNHLKNSGDEHVPLIIIAPRIYCCVMGDTMCQHTLMAPALCPLMVI